MSTDQKSDARRFTLDPWLISLAVVALVLHGVFIASLWQEDVEARQPIIDSAYYADLAQQWAQGGGAVPEGALLLLAPGYPLFLALAVLAVGKRWLLVYAIQAVLNVAGLLLLTDLASRLVSKKAALIAATLVMLYGPYQLFSASLLSEALVIPVVGLFLWLFEARRWPFVQAFLLGYGYLLRPNLGLFMVVLLGWLLFVERRRLRCLVWAMAFVLLIPAFHWVTTGSPLGGSAQSAVALYMGNHPRSDGLFTNTLGLRGSIPEMANQIEVVTERRLDRKLEPNDINRYWRGQVGEWVRTDPSAFVRNLVLKMFRLVDSHEYATDHQWIKDFPTAARLFPVPFAVLLSLAAAGLVGREAWTRPFIPVVLYLAAGVTGLLIFFPSARLRYVLLPALLLLAALGLKTLCRRRPQAVLACSLVFVVSMIGVRDHRRCEDPYGHFNRAKAFYVEGNLESARAFLDRAMAIDWNVSFFHVLDAEILQAEEESGAAVRAYRIAFLLGATDTEVINTVAKDALTRRQWPFAETVFRRAIELYPSGAASYMNLAQVLEAQGKTGEAAIAYRQAIALGSRERPDLERRLYP